MTALDVKNIKPKFGISKIKRSSSLFSSWNYVT